VTVDTATSMPAQVAATTLHTQEGRSTQLLIDFCNYRRGVDLPKSPGVSVILGEFGDQILSV
jgi:hypothetical protein